MPAIGDRGSLAVDADDLAHFLEGRIRWHHVPKRKSMLRRLRFARLRQLRAHQYLPQHETKGIHIRLLEKKGCRNESSLVGMTCQHMPAHGSSCPTKNNRPACSSQRSRRRWCRPASLVTCISWCRLCDWIPYRWCPWTQRASPPAPNRRCSIPRWPVESIMKHIALSSKLRWHTK